MKNFEQIKKDQLETKEMACVKGGNIDIETNPILNYESYPIQLSGVDHEDPIETDPE